MTRVLHTSDWHIGRRFKGFDQTEWQSHALEWLCGLVEDEQVDVLIVAGDVYDQPRPATAAVRLLDRTLERLAGIEANGHPLQIVITPGNHDSAERLGFGAGLMQGNIHIRHRIEDLADPVVIHTGDGPLAIYTLPYLDPDAARPLVQEAAGLDEPPARSHAAVMKAALGPITADLRRRRKGHPGMPAILMAHAFVAGGQASDSERSIEVGGVGSIPAGLFSGTGLDYLALGHLHRSQQVAVPAPDDGSRAPVARYSGSLLAYSFSETPATPTPGNGKSVVLFDIDGDGVHDLRTMPVASGQPSLVRLEGTLDELLGPIADEHQDDWVSLTIDYDDYPRGMFQKLDARYPHALEKIPRCTRATRRATRTMADLRSATSEMDVLDGFVSFMRGTPPTTAERKELEASVRRVRAARHGGGTPAGDGVVADADTAHGGNGGRDDKEGKDGR